MNDRSGSREPSLHTNRNHLPSQNKIITQIGANRKNKLGYELNKHKFRMQETGSVESRGSKQRRKLDATLSGGADSLEMDYNSMAGMSDKIPFS